MVLHVVGGVIHLVQQVVDLVTVTHIVLQVAKVVVILVLATVWQQIVLRFVQMFAKIVAVQIVLQWLVLEQWYRRNNVRKYSSERRFDGYIQYNRRL